MDKDPDPEIPAKARRRQFSARYKAEVLAAYDKLARNERGAFLRREGLYTSNIAEWRHQRDRGAEGHELACERVLEAPCARRKLAPPRTVVEG